MIPRAGSTSDQSLILGLGFGCELQTNVFSPLKAQETATRAVIYLAEMSIQLRFSGSIPSWMFWGFRSIRINGFGVLIAP